QPSLLHAALSPTASLLRRPLSSPPFPYTPLSRPRRATVRRDAARWLWSALRGASRAAPSTARRPRCRQSIPRAPAETRAGRRTRSEEHTSELQSRENLVCRLLLEKKKRQHDRVLC